LKLRYRVLLALPETGPALVKEEDEDYLEKIPIQSSKLLLALASTVVLGFQPRRPP
jgi:hypothetical protein